MLSDIDLRDFWAKWANEQLWKHAAPDNNGTLCMVRLVADGIWLSDFSGIDIADRQSLRDRLIKMTQQDFD